MFDHRRLLAPHVRFADAPASKAIFVGGRHRYKE
jgi:hypothetical protein